MEEYCLNEEGLHRCKGNKEEKYCSGIFLVTLEEFKNLDENMPHKRNMLHSMSSIRFCKVDTYKGCAQGTLIIPPKGRKATEPFTMGFYMYESKLYLIGDIEKLKGYLKKTKEDLAEDCSLNEFFILWFSSLIDEDSLWLQKIEENMERLEEKVIEGRPENFNENILKYRSQLAIIHSYYQQLTSIGDIMQANMSKQLTQDECTMWELFTNRTERLFDMVEDLREYLQHIRELYQAQIDIQQNKFMSFLTVVTTLFLPLTLIAGWYGMNFENMPEIKSKYAYFIVMGAAGLVVAAELLYFKHKKMLWKD